MPRKIMAAATPVYSNDEPSSNIIHLLKRIHDIYGKDTALSDGVINFIKGLLTNTPILKKKEKTLDIMLG